MTNEKTFRCNSNEKWVVIFVLKMTSCQKLTTNFDKLTFSFRRTNPLDVNFDKNTNPLRSIYPLKKVKKW